MTFTRVIICWMTMACLLTAAEPEVDYAAKMAEAYQANAWRDVTAVRFIYNLQHDDQRIARSWTWEPQTNRLTLRGSDQTTEPITFDRDDLTDDSPEQLRRIEAWFVHDSLRLLLPYHLATTQDLTITNGGYKLAPLGRIVARELMVSFPEDHAHLPQRTFKLYVDEAWRINQWTIVPANDDDAALTTIWTTDEQAGPIQFCSRYRNNDAKFHLWYSDVAVKTADENHWQIARVLDHRCRTCP